MKKTLFDKIWEAHVVSTVEEGPTQLYIDRMYCHEVTSPQAFDGLRKRGLKVFRPEQITCMPDHNIPTLNQESPIADPVSKIQVDTLTKNALDFGLTHYQMGNEKNGIIHVVGPEIGLSLPGMTMVCGDSHTSTHGALGAVALVSEPVKWKWYWQHNAFSNRGQKLCVLISTENLMRVLHQKIWLFMLLQR